MRTHYLLYFLSDQQLLQTLFKDTAPTPMHWEHSSLPRQAHRQEMKWGVFFVKKWKMRGILCKKVENGGCFFL